jgi:quercetin 2,3-dioxygenase
VHETNAAEIALKSAVACEREVARVDSPAVEPGYGPGHQVRRLVAPGQWQATDPFLLLNEDWFPDGIFDRHPHRGIETVTYVIDGGIRHWDNHGNTGTIGAGDAQWLTAGRGLIHNEQPVTGEYVHILQLWINLPEADKLVPAHHQKLLAADMPVRREPGVEIRVFSGSSGSARATTRNCAPVTMIEICLDSCARVAQAIPSGFTAFIVIQDGDGMIGAQSIAARAGQVVWLASAERPSMISLEAGKEGLRAFLFAGQPLHEPVVAGGPFVMNTEAELAECFAEYRAQGVRFGL